MGICASCLSGRQKNSDHERSPLLTPEAPAQTYRDTQAAKQQRDLSLIIKKTNDRFIDVNVIGRPDMETIDESIDELREQLNAVDGAKVWTWPQLMALSEQEETVVNAFFEQAKNEPTVELNVDNANLFEEV